MSTAFDRVGQTGAGILILMATGGGLALALNRFQAKSASKEGDKGQQGPSASALVKIITSLLFNVAIPATVWRGIGLKDFSKLPWTFIASFVVIRAVAFAIVAAIATAVALVASWRSRGSSIHGAGDGEASGTFSTRILTRTLRDFLSQWLNTILFGIPLIQAAYGKEFIVFCVFAAISSFIFQLPLQLILLEVRKSLQQPEPSSPSPAASDGAEGSDAQTTGKPDPHDTSSEAPAGSSLTSPPSSPASSSSSPQPSCSQIAKKIALSFVLNPVILGIVLGFITSAARKNAGDSSPTLPIVLESWLGMLADMVTPLAAVGVGAFAVERWGDVFSRDTEWIAVVCNVLAKLLLMPLLALGLLPATGSGKPIEMQIGIVIASLPAALSSYVLSTRYDNRPSDIVVVILAGTVLMAPATTLWTWAVDPAGGGLVSPAPAPA